MTVRLCTTLDNLESSISNEEDTTCCIDISKKIIVGIVQRTFLENMRN